MQRPGRLHSSSNNGQHWGRDAQWIHFRRGTVEEINGKINGNNKCSQLRTRVATSPNTSLKFRYCSMRHIWLAEVSARAALLSTRYWLFSCKMACARALHASTTSLHGCPWQWVCNRDNERDDGCDTRCPLSRPAVKMLCSKTKIADHFIQFFTIVSCAVFSPAEWVYLRTALAGKVNIAGLKSWCAILFWVRLNLVILFAHYKST